jgi:hypothetical protein
MPNDTLPDWEQVLASAAHLQRWRNWQTVKAACADSATLIFDRIVGADE